MQYLCIQNRNEVDRRAFTLLGASVKGDDAIGMFGSGTKYSLATLLRNGLTPHIFSGAAEIVIDSKPTQFRDRAFEVITIDGHETSITTDTGRKWRVDQCIREFYSNALDEGEAGAFITSELVGEVGTTRVFIPMDAHPTPGEMWSEWNKYFIDPNAEPICISPDLDKDSLHWISATGNTPSIMRRGVWCVEDWSSYQAIFSYNLKNVHLPETRLTAATNCRSVCGFVLTQLTNPIALDMLLAQADNEASFEWRALRDGWGTPRPELLAYFSTKFDWIATSRDVGYFPTSMRPRVLICSDSAFYRLKEWGFGDIRKFRNSDILYTEMAWPIGYADRVHAVKAKLKRNGIDFNFPIKFVQIPSFDGGETQVIARADMRSGVCLLTQKAFEDDDDRMLTKALIEEWTHLAHQVNDGTTAQQHVYLDTIVKLLK